MDGRPSWQVTILQSLVVVEWRHCGCGDMLLVVDGQYSTCLPLELPLL